MPDMKPQRIRDPLYDLIEFKNEKFEQILWRVIQTRPFQRLRRVRQLGFSELVYPGATHSRFAHSVGVFHTARSLMKIIERYLESKRFDRDKAETTIAAALVHDLGHGMFSHAFEDIGKKLNLKVADHTIVGDYMIRNGEVAEILCEKSSGFANDVADVVKKNGAATLYDAVVSSQFDADRLDYMQRDRLMTGVRNSGIDYRWLEANLEIGTIQTGTDETNLGDIETFVLGRKAYHAAETYVLSLFQLYSKVYFHKATRAAEKIFSALIVRLVTLVRDGGATQTGLPPRHPILEFAANPDSLDNAMALDDTVFLGALPMLVEASDRTTQDFAVRLRDRKLLKCKDIRRELIAKIAPDWPRHTATQTDVKSVKRKLTRVSKLIEEQLEAWSEENSNHGPRILIDQATRDPYKPFQESKGPLNQIRIRSDVDDRILDMADRSPVVAALESFEVFRAYTDEEDAEAVAVIRDVTAQKIKEDG